MSADSVLGRALWAVVSTKEKLNYHFHWKGKFKHFALTKESFVLTKELGKKKWKSVLTQLNSTQVHPYLFSFLNND